MGDDNKQLQSVNDQTHGKVQPNGLTPHQQAIVDYAMVAATAANRTQTEELAVRTQHAIKTEIHANFEQFTKLTTTRKVMMFVGAVLAFGAGFLVKGALTPKQEMGPNHVDE